MQIWLRLWARCFSFQIYLSVFFPPHVEEHKVGRGDQSPLFGLIFWSSTTLSWQIELWRDQHVHTPFRGLSGGRLDLKHAVLESEVNRTAAVWTEELVQIILVLVQRRRVLGDGRSGRHLAMAMKWRIRHIAGPLWILYRVMAFPSAFLIVNIGLPVCGHWRRIPLVVALFSRIVTSRTSSDALFGGCKSLNFTFLYVYDILSLWSDHSHCRIARAGTIKSANPGGKALKTTDISDFLVNIMGHHLMVIYHKSWRKIFACFCRCLGFRREEVCLVISDDIL